MAWGGTRWGVTGEATEQQLLNRVEEAFDPASAAGHARLGDHRDHLKIGADLLQVSGGEVAAMVGIEPVGMPQTCQCGVVFHQMAWSTSAV